MTHYNQHQHTDYVRDRFTSGNSFQLYRAVVGSVAISTERPIEGPSGDHLQFSINAGDAGVYQVDVNTQSRDGTEIGVYIAEENLTPVSSDKPFGPEQFGLQNAALSYETMGLQNRDFVALPYTRIESQLKADLSGATFVVAHGMTFDDGNNIKGIHEIHFNPSAPGRNKDGALALFTIDVDTKAPKRIWYFFKFQTDAIG